MSNLLAVLLNGIAQLEYDRDKQLPPHQELYLNKMDKQMDEGIQVGDSTITNPDLNQRAQFVAGNLAHAILSDNEAMASALCSYLASRLADLKQVKITSASNPSAAGASPDSLSDSKSDIILDKNQEVSIELVFDEEYQKQTPVQFIH